MHVTKENKAISLSVTEGLTVTVLPDSNHEFLMSLREVASGYGTTLYAIRKCQDRHSTELTEGKHFIKGVDILSTPIGKSANAQPHQVFWTKRGVVRLGFFIKSERAKLFRDWAEELIIRVDEQRDLFGHHVPDVRKMIPEKRKHNRLTQERLLDIMADVCKIDDKELRLSISSKLMTGGAL